VAGRLPPRPGAAAHDTKGIFMIRTGLVSVNSLLGCCLAFALLAPARAATETVLYSFTGSTGQDPQDSPIRDEAGNLYGTTQAGGAGNYGTVFRLAPDGTETVLLSFNSSGGAKPYGRLIADKAGNLYGTTEMGGAHGYGVVVKLTQNGRETVLHSFNGPQGGDGAYPFDGLIMDGTENLYGTTQSGGPAGPAPSSECRRRVPQPCSIPLAMPTPTFRLAA
jgi:uncharacterized repeat protein (TIGR03803 family)